MKLSVKKVVGVVGVVGGTAAAIAAGVLMKLKSKKNYATVPVDEEPADEELEVVPEEEEETEE